MQATCSPYDTTAQGAHMGQEMRTAALPIEAHLLCLLKAHLAAQEVADATVERPGSLLKENEATAQDRGLDSPPPAMRAQSGGHVLPASLGVLRNGVSRIRVRHDHGSKHTYNRTTPVFIL